MAMNEGMEDLKQIEELKEKNYKLQKQVEFLKSTCREAATKIKTLEDRLESFTDPVAKMRKGGM